MLPRSYPFRDGIRAPVSDTLSTETLIAEGVGSLSEPSARGWLSHRRQVEALYRTRRWPLGRAKSLLKSSLSQAAAEAAIGVDFSLGDEEVSFDVVLDRLQARFLPGTDSAPAISEFLDARQTSLEPLPDWFTRLKVLYRRAFPQSSSDPGLYSAFNSRRGSRTLASAITCCAMSVARSRRPFASLSLRSRGSRLPSTYRGGRNHLPRATVPPVDSAACSLLPRNPA